LCGLERWKTTRPDHRRNRTGHVCIITIQL